MLSIMSMGILATLVNMFGAVHDKKVPTDAIFGGFIVTTILMLGGRSKFSSIAKMLMLAFLITSFSFNAKPLFGLITNMTSDNNTINSEGEKQ